MEWAVRAIGVVYLCGGLTLLAQAMLNWRLQRRMAALSLSSLTEVAADTATTLAAVVVLMSGVALLALSVWAVAAFLTGWTLQAGYLFWAGRWRGARDPIAFGGRRRSLDAFALYTLATGLVLGLPLMGLLN